MHALNKSFWFTNNSLNSVILLFVLVKGFYFLLQLRLRCKIWRKCWTNEERQLLYRLRAQVSTVHGCRSFNPFIYAYEQCSSVGSHLEVRKQPSEVPLGFACDFKGRYWLYVIGEHWQRVSIRRPWWILPPMELEFNYHRQHMSKKRC